MVDVVGAAARAQLPLELRGRSRVSRSQLDLQAIAGHLDALLAQHGALGGVLIEDRVGVVDVDQNPARVRGQAVEPLEHAARAALRQVPDVARALLRQAEA